MAKSNLILSRPLYFRNINDELNMDLSTYVLGYEKCSKTKNPIKLKKNLHVIHYIISGSGYIKYKGQNNFTKCKSGNCFLVKPGEEVEYYQDSKDPWTYFWFEFSGPLGNKLVKTADFKTYDNILFIENDKAIKKIINKLINEKSFKSNSISETLRIQSLILSFFSIIIDEYHKEETVEKLSNKEIQIKSIERYIENNFTSSELTVQKIADEFHFNASYLTRIFKENIGVSPMKYIINLRMREAVTMIKKEAYTILQIAYALGYKNQFYFSKEFKKFYGVPPSEYIKNAN